MFGNHFCLLIIRCVNSFIFGSIAVLVSFFNFCYSILWSHLHLWLRFKDVLKLHNWNLLFTSRSLKRERNLNCRWCVLWVTITMFRFRVSACCSILFLDIWVINTKWRNIIIFLILVQSTDTVKINIIIFLMINRFIIIKKSVE